MTNEYTVLDHGYLKYIEHYGSDGRRDRSMSSNILIATIRWIGVYPDGQFAGLDQNSGGYPFPTRNFRELYVWLSREQCEEYLKMFPGLQAKKVRISVEEISDV